MIKVDLNKIAKAYSPLVIAQVKEEYKQNKIKNLLDLLVIFTNYNSGRKMKR